MEIKVNSILPSLGIMILSVLNAKVGVTYQVNVQTKEL